MEMAMSRGKEGQLKSLSKVVPPYPLLFSFPLVMLSKLGAKISSR